MAEFQNEIQTVPNSGILTEKRLFGIRHDTGADYILPDYMGDVKKLLDYSAKLIPSGRFIGSEDVSFVGVACYSVIYLDNENKLTEASFTSDYEIEHKISEAPRDADAKTEIASLSVRLQGPRKISAKAALVSEIFMTESKELPYPEDKEGIETEKRQIKIHTPVYMRSGEREYAEVAARLEGVSAEEVDVIFSGGGVRFDEVKTVTDGIDVRGALELETVLKIGEETALRVEKKLPFEEHLAAENSVVAGKPFAEGYITSIKVNVNNEAAEDSGTVGASVNFNACAEYFARCDENKTVELIADAFSTAQSTENKLENIGYVELIDSINETKRLSFEMPRAELECEGLSEILHTGSHVKLSNVEINDGNLIAEGEISFVCVAKGEGDNGYVSIKRTFPLNERRVLERTPTSTPKISCHLYTSDVNSSFDASKLYFGCNLTVCAVITEEKKASAVSAIIPIEATEESGEECTVSVYYPEGTETLWSIAKKYKVSPLSIAEENMLSADCLSSNSIEKPLAGVEKLIIFKG